MSAGTGDPTADGGTAGSAETRGVFPDDASLQAAMQALQVNGFNRADLSLPRTDAAATTATPDRGSENPQTDDDVRQLRTMGTGTIGATGALVGAGVVIATGGAALVAGAAAAAIGAGAAAATAAMHQGIDRARHDEREELGRRGRLVLAVRTPDEASRAKARDIMAQNGGTQEQDEPGQGSATLDSAAWTG